MHYVYLIRARQTAEAGLERGSPCERVTAPGTQVRDRELRRALPAHRVGAAADSSLPSEAWENSERLSATQALRGQKSQVRQTYGMF